MPHHPAGSIETVDIGHGVLRLDTFADRFSLYIYSRLALGVPSYPNRPSCSTSNAADFDAIPVMESGASFLPAFISGDLQTVRNLGRIVQHTQFAVQYAGFWVGHAQHSQPLLEASRRVARIQCAA